jgi:hypothetical protein
MAVTENRKPTLQPDGHKAPVRNSARMLELMFALQSLATLRCFRSSLELLVKRGHDVRLVLEKDSDGATTQPTMTAIPHRLVVWNETQRREAVGLHRFRAERVVVGRAD